MNKDLIKRIVYCWRMTSDSVNLLQGVKEAYTSDPKNIVDKWNDQGNEYLYFYKLLSVHDVDPDLEFDRIESGDLFLIKELTTKGKYNGNR